MSNGERRLGAIMFTDVVGYSAITSQNEQRALRILKDLGGLLQSIFPKYSGKVIKTTGDGYLVEFASAVQAVKCAVDIQRRMSDFDGGSGEKVALRIGIHVGDVVHSGGDVLGDAVNVAARVQPLADPGGISLTRQVVDQVQRKVDFNMISMGVRDLKNIQYPVEIFKVDMAKGVQWTGSQMLDPRRVAVLPFTNMSPDPNDRYFADGMTEEVISTVAKISELQVISRTSVMRYKDSIIPLSQIGQELAVGSVLEGSVRKAGNKVRITAQLISVESDKHVWSQSYDRDLNDVFAIQADIAEQVAGSLKIQLLSREKQSIRKDATKSTEAYTFYLKGRFFWAERTEENTKKALRYFEEAAKLDPNFAMAYSGIADAYSIFSDYGWMPPGEAGALAKANASKALQIDDSLAEAHASMGVILCNVDWDVDGADRELKRAVELKPNYAQAHHWFGINQFFRRRHDESMAAVQRALKLDPYSRVYNMVSTNQLLFQRKYDEALGRYAELIRAYPDFSALWYWRSVCYLLAGRYEEAVDDARKYVAIEGSSWTSAYSNLHLGLVFASAGMRGEAEAKVEEGIRLKRDRDVSSTAIGWVMLALGRKDEGYEWLERAFSERDPGLLYFTGFPWTSGLRQDARWKAIESKFPFRIEPDTEAW